MLRKRSVVVLILCAASTFCLFRFLSAHVEPGLSPRATVILKEFPKDPSLFKEEVQPYVQKIIERHGDEEWKACLLTNELHRHLGMWSIIGAKMGVRAREILEVPFDELDVISFAGSKQPLSCLTDGLQVSTGASLGRGAITVAHVDQPVAVFIYKDKKVTLRVKPEIIKEMRDTIQDLSKKFTFQSPKYFQELDKKAIETWLKWDRKKIFEEMVG
jgi:pyrimidine-specific ribonucleoside hydrolase